MRKIFNRAIAIELGSFGLLLPAIAGAAPLSSWYGRYVWEESIGRIGGATPAEGAAAFVTYTLTLGRGTGPTGCTLKGEGYQTHKSLRCTATPQGDAVIVRYYGAGPDLRGERYRRGAALFTLRRSGRGIVTQLHALAPSSDSAPRRGRLFNRVG